MLEISKYKTECALHYNVIHTVHFFKMDHGMNGYVGVYI